jgi:hypothetical protein
MPEEEFLMDQPANAPSFWWQKPAGLGVLGLVLMFAGYKVTTYLPSTDREDAQNQLLTDLREKARKEPGQLSETVDRYASKIQRTPPYEIPGRLVFFSGLAAFVGAGFLMYRAPAATPEEARLKKETGSDE